MGVYAADIETSGLIEQMLLQDNPKLHNICSLAVDSDEMVLIEGSDKKAVQAWLDEGHTFITHNCKTFDDPALALLGYDTSKVKWIDSLPLSWYLEPQRMRHGLAEYGEEFGVPKPVIENWETQTQEEYNHRVQEDCKIQKKLWQKQVVRLKELYGSESFDKLINFLMWKMDQQRIQQDCKWKLDVDGALTLQEELRVEIEKKVVALTEVMPQVAVVAIRNPPAKKFKKNGELSATGEKWKELTERNNLPFTHDGEIKEVTSYKQGNPASHQQIKDWLYSFGWEPATFKFVREENGENRQIPQVNLKGGLVCDSVIELIPQCQGIEHIAGLGILNHRYSVVSAFLRDQVGGFLVAGCQGFTNTLRLQHREIVNLPSLRVKYGKELRGLLVAREGYVLLGADLSSLEDRIKHHFQWNLDPDYVKSQMSSDFDPHLLIAVLAGLMSEEDCSWYKMYKASDKASHNVADDHKFQKLDEIRGAGKSTNYACQYGAGAETVARTAKVPLRIGKKLHAGYHKLNWSIEKIAGMTTVKNTSFGEWQYNPITKLWYSLRSKKDRFSTLVQGSGAYVMDLWLFYCNKLAKQRGMEFRLLASFH